jgi:amino acid permease
MLTNIFLGMGPKLFAYVDRKGRPVVVTILQIIFGCLAFVNLAPSGGTIFNWLLALSGLSSFFIFGSIAIAHIRFRKAWYVIYCEAQRQASTDKAIGPCKAIVSTSSPSRPCLVLLEATSARS